jgi:putative flippase GtrA
MGIADVETTRHPRLSLSATAYRYAAVVVIASLSNIGAQHFSLAIVPDLQIVASVAIGTGVGFIVKFICDKYWVFLDTTYAGHTAEARKFIVYGFLGIATTAIFWVVEISFWYIFKTPEAKYAGAVLGLTIGSIIKYLLDKRYVFTSDRQ